MQKSKEQKLDLINGFRLHKNDCGSTVVQISSLSYDINVLTEYFKKFKKDNHSKRGLIKKVSRRRRLLNYLKKTDCDSYMSTIKRLNIRK